MSRYVTSRHGIIIGSGNNFFYWDEDGNIHDYPCILSVQGYNFDQINSVTVNLRTPAQQLLITKVTQPEPDRFRPEYIIDHKVEAPSAFLAGWLERNVAEGRWSYHVDRQTRRMTLYFERRRDAVALSRAVDKQLKGIAIDR